MSTNSDSAIYIIAPHPVFNPAAVNSFADFDKADSVILYSTLLENLLEVVNSLKLLTDNYLLLNYEDETLFRPSEQKNLTINFLPDDYELNLLKFLSGLSEKYIKNYIILADSIGISSESITHCSNLLNREDDALVIGKTFSGFISCLAFNKSEINYLEHLLKSEYDYMKFLSRLDTCSAFINIIEKFQRITSIDDFIKLYIELSKKDSLNYCSQEMHERFTHLFIEHKGLLQ
ncbi:MAG: hypothetical protein R6W68_06750 [Ignavibacteriaceae bacterium]